MTTRPPLLAALAFLLALPAWPQASTATVRGTVTDQTGAVVPGAAVDLTNVATNVKSQTRSNEIGFYMFPGIVPGRYQLAVESAGMQKKEVTLTVQVQQSAVVDVVLVPGQTSTAIEVRDVTPVMVVDNPTLGHVLERTRIEQLPINGRSLSSLLVTVPGMEGTRAFGLREGSQEFVLDGAVQTDRLFGGTMSRQPGLDTIEEFKVEVNNSSAKFTRPTSIIMSTKSGSNQIHGSLFETHRNNGLGKARTRTDTYSKPPQLIRNEFGGSLGGPVYLPKVYDGRNRTFFFSSYEGYRNISSTIAGGRVFTEAMRKGDFSGLVDSVGRRTTLYDPWTTGADWNRQPFNYGGKINNIDPNRMSPMAKYLYNITPLPTLPDVNPLLENNWWGNYPSEGRNWTTTVRIDHRFSDNDSFYGRFTRSKYLQRGAMSTSYVPTLDKSANFTRTDAPNVGLALSWVHTFSPTLFNEVLLSGQRQVWMNFTGDPGAFYADKMGTPNPFGSDGWPGVYDVGIGNTYYYESTNGQSSRFNYFILDDNATKVIGRHELMFGFHGRMDQLTSLPQQQNVAGLISFATNATSIWDPSQGREDPQATAFAGHNAANMYIGVANYTNQFARGNFYMRGREYALYFQDNFKVTPRLTLNLGLRWQFSPYPYDKYNVMSSFDRKNMAIVLGQPLEKLYQMGVVNPSLIRSLEGFGAKFETYEQAGLPKKLVHDNWRDIGPHVGFAYRAFDGPRSFVIRGGFSTNYNTIPIYGWNDRMRLNSPFAAYYQNYSLTDAAQSPDGVGNFGLITTPTVVAGKNSANVVTFDKPMGVTPGSDFFGNAYFAYSQPSSRVHDWNLTVEKEIMRDTVLRVAYIGNHAAYQDSYSDWNAVMPEYNWVVTTKTTPPAGTWADTALRPNPTLPYADVQEYRKDGYGNSNGAQIELQRRYSKGIGFQVFYTLVNANKAAAHGWYSDSSLAPVNSFLPGTVPTNDSDRMRLLLYKRDTTIPQHEIRFNWIADLPFGKGKMLAGNANRLVDALIGGWQVSGLGRWKSNWFDLPADGTELWPTGNPVEYYGHQYPIEDCRSGTCRPGYLLWNGYIPAHQINSTDPKTGKPNGVMGVPSNYKPAAAPLHPYPADYLSRSPSTDPRFNDYGTSNVYLPLNDGTTYRMEMTGGTAGSPLHPWINQPIRSTNIWNVDASIFKTFAFSERFKLRVQADFFNVFNTPGNNWGGGSDGLVDSWTNANTPRVTQLSARFTW